MEIAVDDVLWVIERALAGMVQIAEELGDESVNRRPELEGANSPFAILTHCVGVADFWIGALIAGRPVERDRDAEFLAAGTVAEIEHAVDGLRERLRSDLADVDAAAPVRDHPLLPRQREQSPRTWSRGRALLHAYEELAQHHGQMELTRDMLLVASGR